MASCVAVDIIVRSEDFHNMQCMLHTVNNSILVGGHQQSVFELDIDRLALIKKVNSKESFNFNLNFI